MTREQEREVLANFVEWLADNDRCIAEWVGGGACDGACDADELIERFMSERER